MCGIFDDVAFAKRTFESVVHEQVVDWFHNFLQDGIGTVMFKWKIYCGICRLRNLSGSKKTFLNTQVERATS